MAAEVRSAGRGLQVGARGVTSIGLPSALGVMHGPHRTRVSSGFLGPRPLDTHRGHLWAPPAYREHLSALVAHLNRVGNF